MPGPLAVIFDFIARDGLTTPLNRMGTAAEVNAKRIGTMNRASEESVAKSAAAGKAWSNLTGVTAKLGLELGAAALAFKAFELGSQFQRQMLQIQTLTGGSAAEVRDMSKAVLGLAGQVGAAPDKLAVSLYHVESVGLRGAAAIDVVKTAAEGAKIGMADLEETTNALTSTVASGIPGVKDMSQAMGALITIVGAGDMKMSDLNEALGGGILSVVKGYGLSLNDVGAALATFGDNNIRGADAATALRMAVMALAVPAKTGKKAIESIGLSMDTLQKDMQQGGLNQAILDLQAHMKQAGITGVQVGGFLTEAFGKRAGIGLSVLMGQVDRFESKVAAIKDGAAGFQSKWQETTRTVGFAFDTIKAKVDAALIKGFEDAAPAITSVLTVLGRDVPHALSVLATVLGPTAHLVGTVLVGAWRALKIVLSGAADALGAVAGFITAHKETFTALATAVLAVWAAFKAYKIAMVAFEAVQTAIVLTRVRLLELRDAQAATAVSSGGLNASSIALKGSLLAVGAAVGVVMYLHEKHASLVARDKSAVDAYTSAIQADSGALGDNVRAQAAKALGDDNAFAQGRKMGIGQKELTDAVLGNAAALDDVKKKMQAYKEETGHNASAAQYLGFILDVNTDRLGKAKVKADDLAAATAKGTDAAKAQAAVIPTLTQFQKDLARAQGEAQVKINGVTYAMKGQSSAADVLNAALARLSGDKNAFAESQLALEDSLGGLTDQINQQAKQYKDNGTSLKENTAEGRKNLEWLHSQIDLTNQSASAQMKAGASLDTVNATLAKNEKHIYDVATANHLNGKEVQALLDKYGVTPKELLTYFKANTDQAGSKALSIQKKIDNLTKQRLAVIKIGDETGEGNKHIQDELDALTQPRTITITPVLKALNARLSGAIVNGIGLNAGGTDNWRGGLTWVGEEGPELLDLPTGSKITSHPEAMQRAAAAGGSTTITQNFYNAVRETPSQSAAAALRAKSLRLGAR